MLGAAAAYSSESAESDDDSSQGAAKYDPDSGIPYLKARRVSQTDLTAPRETKERRRKSLTDITSASDGDQQQQQSGTRRRLSVSDADHGASAKLALVEAKVELDEMRIQLVAAQAERATALVELKTKARLAEMAAKRNEAIVAELRGQTEAVRAALQVELTAAEETELLANEEWAAKERALRAEVEEARGAVRAAAASAIQRVGHTERAATLTPPLQTPSPIARRSSISDGPACFTSAQSRPTSAPMRARRRVLGYATSLMSRNGF